MVWANSSAPAKWNDLPWFKVAGISITSPRDGYGRWCFRYKACFVEIGGFEFDHNDVSDNQNEIFYSLTQLRMWCSLCRAELKLKLHGERKHGWIKYVFCPHCLFLCFLLGVQGHLDRGGNYIGPLGTADYFSLHQWQLPENLLWFNSGVCNDILRNPLRGPHIISYYVMSLVLLKMKPP